MASRNTFFTPKGKKAAARKFPSKPAGLHEDKRKDRKALLPPKKRK